MNGTALDARAAAGTLRAGPATKADFDNLEARLQATLYRALRIQGGAIIAILAAMRFFGQPVAPPVCFSRRPGDPSSPAPE